MRVRRGVARLMSVALAVAAFAVVLPYSAPKQVDAACAPTLAQPQQIVQRTSDSKFRVVLTNAVDGLKGMPAEAASLVGLNEDDSPEWTNPADGRIYWYEAQASMLWQESDPCTGPDTYWASMDVTCRRHGPSGNVDTPCWFDNMYLALHRGSSDGTIWVNPWGYHKYVRANDTGCGATNSGHTIDDDKLARSKVIMHMFFRNPFDESELLHETQTREMTSHWINRGFFTGSGQDLSGSSIPSYTVGPSIC